VTAADETPLGRAPRTTAGSDAVPEFVRVVDAAIPTTPAALQPWLVAGSYRGWSHESKRHPSSGPHAEEVVTYLSPALEESLRVHAKAHPVRASAVKELFKGGKHVGWAVSVKTTADSARGKNWYWYEVLSTAPDAKSPEQGLGLELCRDCHSENGGIDQVLIDFPLR
jgi:hypothetical protein